MKILGGLLLFAGVSRFAFAGTFTVPEISPASGAAAIALVSGAILVLRSRRNK